jgi:hypothetical protein
MLLVGAISYGLIKSKINYFIEQGETSKEYETSMDEFLFKYCIVILVACVFIFFVAHYNAPFDLYDD